MAEKKPLITERGKEFRVSLSGPRGSSDASRDSVSDHSLRIFKDVKKAPAPATKVYLPPSIPIDGIEIEVQISKQQFFMQVVRASVGTGIIALPSAVSNAGLLFGMVGISVVSIIIIHCVHLLVESAQFLRTRYQLSTVDLDYGNTVKYAFIHGPEWCRRFRWMAKILNICLGVTQFGIGTIYLLFVAENIKYLVDHYAQNFSQPVIVYLLIVIVIVMPLIFIRSIRILSNISCAGNFFMMLGVVLILSYCLQDIPDVSTYPLITDIQRLPLFFGVAVFAFESITVILPNENVLDDKGSLPGCCGLLNLSFGLVLILYLTIAFYGYAKFGDSVKGSITYSMPSTPWYYMIVKPLYASLIAMSFGLQFYVFIEVLWQALRPYTTRRVWFRHFCAIVCLFTMFGAAAGVPHVEHMISLVGALSGSALCLIFPAFLHIIVFWEHKYDSCCFSLIVLKNIFIIIFGIFGAVIGSYSSLLAIVNAFQSKEISGQ